MTIVFASALSLALVLGSMALANVAIAQADPPPATPGVGGGAGPTYGGTPNNPSSTGKPDAATAPSNPSPGATLGQGSPKRSGQPAPGGSFVPSPKR